MERLEVIVDAENVGSQRVQDKAGFQSEGVLRKYMILKGKTKDLAMFSLLSSDSKSKLFVQSFCFCFILYVIYES